MLDAVVDPAVLGTDRGDTRPRGVDVQPRAVLLRDHGDGRRGVDRAGGRRPDRRLHQHRPDAGGHVGGHRLAQGGDVHGLRLRVDGDRADGALAEAAHHRGLEQRRVGLGGAVDREGPGRYAVATGRTTGRAVQRGQDGGERRGRGGVLDDAPAQAVPGERVRQAERLAELVEDDLLELGRGRAGRPEHPLGADAAGEQVAQHAGGGGVRREVREEARVLPVREAGDEVLVQVRQHGLERLRLLRQRRRQRRRHVARLHLGEHGQVVDGLPVVRDPVHDPVSLLAELVRRQVRRTHARGRLVAAAA